MSLLLVSTTALEGPRLWEEQARIRWIKYGIEPEACYTWFHCDYKEERFPAQVVCKYHARFRMPAAG